MSATAGHPIGPVADFPVGSWRTVPVGRREIGVYNTGERLHAVLNVCPHQAAPLCLGPLGGTMVPGRPGEREYGLENRVVRCPWHGWEFDVITGEMLFGTGSRRLTVYPVAVHDGRVFVGVPRSRRRERDVAFDD